jgi:hypothetical protein
MKVIQLQHSPSARQPRSSTRRQTVRRCTLYGRTLTLLAYTGGIRRWLTTVAVSLLPLRICTNKSRDILQIGPCIFKLRRNKTNEMHIQSKVNNIFRISILLLHVSALYERHLRGAQKDPDENVRMLLHKCRIKSKDLLQTDGIHFLPSLSVLHLLIFMELKLSTVLHGGGGIDLSV